MKLYSNEIVFRGHPDKVCDQISDALLDECLKQDKNSRCGIEVMGGKGKIFVTGEVTSKAKLDVEKTVKRVLKDVGYSDKYEVIDNLGRQSVDIALGTNDEVAGAGDNGMMFGYACKDTEELLPTAMVILQRLSREYDKLRKEDSRFLADGKAQITGVYNDENKLLKIKTFTVCYQNTEEERDKTDKIIKDICEKIAKDYDVEIEEFLINPTGRFCIGGFEGDAGLTGRKIVVDSYQSFANVGGGAFSGKDPTKVDRSGAYAARWVAKNIVAAQLAEKCEVQIAYAIGVAHPVSIMVDTFGTSNYSNNELVKIIHNNFDLRPKSIIESLDLKKTIYRNLSSYGHMGREDLNLKWEQIFRF